MLVGKVFVFDGSSKAEKNGKALEYVKKSLPPLGAVVFDIDDTLVDGNERRKAILSSFFDYLRRKKTYKIFAVTARPYSIRNYLDTMQMLKDRKLNVERLYMMTPPPPGFSSLSDAARYKYIFDKKKSARRQIVSTFGMKIVLNAGDMFHDLAPSPPVKNAQEKSVVFWRNGVLSWKVA